MGVPEKKRKGVHYLMGKGKEKGDAYPPFTGNEESSRISRTGGGGEKRLGRGKEKGSLSPDLQGKNVVNDPYHLCEKGKRQGETFSSLDR